MKKNLALAAILLVLVALTYVFQEKRTHDEHRRAELAGRVFPEEIRRLRLGSVTAVKKGGQWWHGDVLLSHNAFKVIEKKLTQVKKVKDIQGEFETYFSRPFVFDVDDVQWSIGDLSLDKQAFYLARGREVMLAVVEGESSELTENPEEIAAVKLTELLTQLSKPLEELKEKQLFRFYPDLPSEKVVVEADGNLPYELDFAKNTTSPPPIAGVSVHDQLKGKFVSLVTQMTIREEVPYEQNEFFKKLGALSFIEGPKRVAWELWIKDGKSADAFIVDPGAKRAFSMIGGTLKVIFLHLQEYWDKKTIPPSAFRQFTRLPTKFVQGTKAAEVVVLNKEPLAFEAKTHSVIQETMEGLFQIIFNLGRRDQADRVSLLSNTERKLLLSEDRLRIEVMGQDLAIWRKADELIVVNLTQGFKTHYHLLDEKFRGTFEDVLK